MIRTIQRNIIRNQLGGSSKALREAWARRMNRIGIEPPVPKKVNTSRITRLISKISRLFNRRQNG